MFPPQNHRCRYSKQADSPTRQPAEPAPSTVVLWESPGDIFCRPPHGRQVHKFKVSPRPAQAIGQYAKVPVEESALLPGPWPGLVPRAWQQAPPADKKFFSAYDFSVRLLSGSLGSESSRGAGLASRNRLGARHLGIALSGQHYLRPRPPCQV